MAEPSPVFYSFLKELFLLDFHLTMMGKKFYERDVPRIADNLEALAQEQAKANQLKERELNIREEELKRQNKPSQN